MAELVLGASAEPLPPAEQQSWVYAGFRREGLLVWQTWKREKDWRSSLQAAFEAAEEQGQADWWPDLSVIHIDLGHGDRPVRHTLQQEFSNADRGVRGLEARYLGWQKRYAPSQMIAYGLTFNEAAQAFYGDIYRRGARGMEGTLEFFVWESRQIFLVREPEGWRAVPTYRCNELVPMSAVNKQGTETLAQGMAEWMLRNVDSSGKMLYKYWPEINRTSQVDNMIRQSMASVALQRWARSSGDPEARRKADANLAYHLASRYRQDGEMGYIYYDNPELGPSAKLGSAALTGLAILESPNRPEHASELQALLHTTLELQQPSGRFTTYLLPEGETGNQNYYPGETLYFWSFLLGEEDFRHLEDPFRRSFLYYRDWHLVPSHRDPAFVPWQTQACFRAWQVLEDDSFREDLAEFVFLMNDWLIQEMSQWETAPAPDMRGRFYAPERDFGPPHSSSTGVYLEGLADAFLLARNKGDMKRQAAYRQAILRGIRSVMQLQLRDEIDMYYVRDRSKAKGGIRTTVYDPTIRVDNVQHNLMAVMKILDSFEEGDFSL